jgi:hypothetical protein
MERMEVSHEDRCYWGDDIYGHPDHPDALLLPDAKRSVSLQILCLRNLLQNVSTILDHDILPTFPTSRRAIPCHVLASSESSCWYALQARDSQADCRPFYFGQITGTEIFLTDSVSTGENGTSERWLLNQNHMKRISNIHN